MNIPDVIIGEEEENEKEVVIEKMIVVEIVKEVPTMIVIVKEIIKETVIAIVFATVKELDDLMMDLLVDPSQLLLRNLPALAKILATQLLKLLKLLRRFLVLVLVPNVLFGYK